MSTVAHLVETTIDHLTGGARPMLVVTSGTVSASATSITFEDSTNIGTGSYICFEAGPSSYEMVYVRSVNQSLRSAEVIRGQRGTTAVTLGDGVIGEVDPQFPRHRILALLADEIRSWPATVFRVGLYFLEESSEGGVWTLPSDLVDPVFALFQSTLDVRIVTTDGQIIRPDYREVHDRLSIASLDPARYRIALGSGVPAGATVEADLALGFDLTFIAVEATTLADIVGLPPEMWDIPPLGVAWRLMTGRDIRRSLLDSQGDTRRAEEVPAGFSGSVATFLKRTRDARLGEEATRLRAKYPLRRH